MKRLLMLVLSGIMVMAVSGLIFIGCTKEGPQGPAGANGTNGKDANATCTLCHNFGDTVIVKIFQYDASQHATGSTVFEATRTACAPCHSHEGFLDCVASGADTSNQAYYNAAPINCRTCHSIHTTYTDADWALRTVAPYTARYDKSVTIDLTVPGAMPGAPSDGTSNLCGRCHQARSAAPWPTNPKGTDSLSVTSTRWGPHHGPQSLILAGKGALEMGAAAYGSTGHKNKASCGTCHQGQAQGDLVGGHTLWMNNAEVGDNVAVCKTCHSSIGSTFDLGGKQTEIAGMYQQLKVLLAAKNILDTNTMLLKGPISAAKPKKFTQITLSVYWNFCLVDADRSMGVHNYKYTYDMLNSGINYMSAQ